MQIKNTANLAILALVSLMISIGCSALMYKTAEANKLVDQANAIITKNNQTTLKANALSEKLLGQELLRAENIESYKKGNKAGFDELIALNEGSEKANNECAAKFEAASKLDLDPNYKEYLALKASETKKRAEIDKGYAAFVRTFMETKEVEKINKLIDTHEEARKKIEAEAEELLKKAEGIQKANPGLFQ